MPPSSPDAQTQSEKQRNFVFFNIQKIQIHEHNKNKK